MHDTRMLIAMALSRVGWWKGDGGEEEQSGLAQQAGELISHAL